MNDQQSKYFWSWLMGQAVFMIVATIVVMLILRPFGVSDMSVVYALYVCGVALLAAFAFVIVALMSHFVFHWHSDRYWFASLLHIPFMVLLVSVFLTFYEGALFCGGLCNAWFDAEGAFTLSHFGLDVLYASAMSIVVGGFSVFFEYNRSLRVSLREAMEMNAALASHAAQPSRPQSQINLEGTSRESLSLPSADDILYVESDANYVNVYYLAGDALQRKTLRATLKSVEEQLRDCPSMLRCHRAFIVNMNRVVSVSGNSQGYRLRVQMTDAEVPVSRQYSVVVYERLKG